MRKFPVLLIVVAAGCSGGGPGAGSKHDPVGAVQKGPFLEGTEVTVQTVNDALEPTGDSYVAFTEGVMGAFQFSSAVDARWVEIVGNGYFFDEVVETTSDGPLTLRAYCDLQENEVCNLNVVTTLAAARTKALVEGGASFADASRSATNQAFGIFHVTDAFGAGDDLDIAADGDGNSALLAGSLLLLYGSHLHATGPVSADLSQVMAALANDLAADGLVADAEATPVLKDASYLLPFNRFRRALETYYTSNGVTADVPAFEDFVDTDWDGTRNGLDADFALFPGISTGFSAEIRWIPPDSQFGGPSLNVSVEQPVTSETCVAGINLGCEVDWDDSGSLHDAGDPVATYGIGPQEFENWNRVDVPMPVVDGDYIVYVDCSLGGQLPTHYKVLVFDSAGNGTQVVPECTTDVGVDHRSVVHVTWPGLTITELP